MTIHADAAEQVWPDDPYLTGHAAPVFDELDVGELSVTGELPAGLRGSYLRNGPNAAFPPLGRYHVFDGDGMLHAVDLDGDGGARYRNRWVESRGLQGEREAGRALYGGLSGFVVPDPDTVQRFGMMKNTANTHIVRHAGHLFALMEACPPTEVRPDLSTVGEYDFGGRLVGSMTAHPKVDPDTGGMTFFGYGPFPPFLRYHEVDAEGVLTHSAEIDLPRAVMMHDFVVTSGHVVFFDLPAVFDVPRMIEGGPGITWEPAMGARIGVLPRFGTNDDVRWIDVEPFMAFHFLNGFDDGGRIVAEGCRAPRLPVTFGDEVLSEPCAPVLWRWTIDPAAGTVVDEQLDERASDFPRINDDVAGKPNRYGYVASIRDPESIDLQMDGVVKVDRATGTLTPFVFGDGAVAGETAFAPDPDGTAEDDGWLLNIVSWPAEGESALVVLDARDLAAGPVATVHLPRRVPLGFHGNWMPTEA